MAEVRPHGIALVPWVLFALAMTGGAFVFLGFASWALVEALLGEAEVEPGENVPLSIIFIVIAIPASIGFAFATVAGALWWAIIRPHPNPHA
jgi:hypothetical protein